MSHIGRRAFLLSSAAAGLAACAPKSRIAAPGAAPAAAQARAIYDSVFEQMLQLSPEAATNLGLDTGARAGLKSRLADRAVTGRTGWWGPLIEALPRLRAIDAASLPLRERALRDTAIWFGERARESRAIPYGAGQTPYVLTQLYGSSISLPNFLDTEHKIETTADAQAYLDRLDAYHRNVDAEVAMAREDAAAGMVPPGFILDKALAQTRTALGQRGAQADLVRSLVRRTREKNLAGDWEARAVRIVHGPIAAALGRQEALLADLRTRAGDTAGIGTRPQGREFYANALRYYTSTDLDAEAVHRLGLAEVARLTGRGGPLLRAQGITQGPIGQRIAALEKLPGQLFAKDDAGRRELLAYIDGWMERLRPRMPSSSTRSRPARWRSAACRWRSRWARPAPMRSRPTSKGRGPGIFYINLRTSTAARASARRR
jgi:uncharacterized protein (DUF885 family)